jgi:hypothetical protein
MKFLILTLVFASLPIYGQEKTPKPTHQEKHTQDTKKPDSNESPTASDARVVINQETTNTYSNGTVNDTKGYLARLLTPENLPNIGLLIAGAIGICVALKTLRTIRRQGIIMIQQTRVLQRQTKATEKAAKAAEDSIELVIKKERARVRVELKPLDLRPQPTYTVDFAVTVLGATAAYIRNSGCVAYETPEDWIDEPGLGSAVMFPIYSLPNAIPPTLAPLEQFAVLDFGENTRDSTISEIKTGRLFVGVRGFIEYRDVFDRDHVTKFRYVWRLNPIFGMAEEFGEWQKCGTEDENQET